MKTKTGTIWARHALTDQGWLVDVSVGIGSDGLITSVQGETQPAADAIECGVLLPGVANLHSHAFQRAMAGLTEHRGGSNDSFWSWRDLMYRFVAQLQPEDVQAISAFVCLQSLTAGYTSLVEFHYLHHQDGGQPYDDLAETSARVVAAATESGIGLTLLPVMYEQGGCDGRALQTEQLRFYNDIDRYRRLHESAARITAAARDDYICGIAPHSLRAVSQNSLTSLRSLSPNTPVHIHIAEQIAEVDEVSHAWGQRPVQWLLENHPVDPRWCLIHATHMTDEETVALAKSEAVAGLCPVTEANLGDGIFNGVTYQAAGGRYGIGTDSNIQISVVNELRLLEYSQRLRDRSRAALASADQSTGRRLYALAAAGGAQAAGRAAGVISAGRLADLVALDDQNITLTDLNGDAILDSYIFAGDDHLVTDVWSAGRHLVQQGRHIHADRIEQRYLTTISRLRQQL